MICARSRWLSRLDFQQQAVRRCRSSSRTLETHKDSRAHPQRARSARLRLSRRDRLYRFGGSPATMPKFPARERREKKAARLRRANLCLITACFYRRFIGGLSEHDPPDSSPVCGTYMVHPPRSRRCIRLSVQRIWSDTKQ